MTTLKVVLDTNVILAGLAYPGSSCGKILQVWRAGAIDVYLSEFILEELRSVLPRLAHGHGLNEREIDDLVDVLSFQAELVVPQSLSETGLRDENGLPVLGTFIAAAAIFQADYLICGDKDLLILSNTYPIISPADFWQRHG